MLLRRLGEEGAAAAPGAAGLGPPPGSMAPPMGPPGMGMGCGGAPLGGAPSMAPMGMQQMQPMGNWKGGPGPGPGGPPPGTMGPGMGPGPPLHFIGPARICEDMPIIRVLKCTIFESDPKKIQK